MKSSVNGIFSINKPAGLTSMDVVRQVKRLVSQKHVGHGGTLDPAATGVLPICVGQATRLMEYVVDGDKEYVGTIRLGIATDTYDADGKVTREQDAAHVTLQAIEDVLESFRGTILQTPPMYSALKQEGKRLYHLARRGLEVQRAARSVKVRNLEVVEWAPPLLTVSLLCSRGVYVRSLANDLGETLGCGGHLAKLQRIRTGMFRVDQAVSLDTLKDAFSRGDWERYLLPPDYAVRHLDAVSLKPWEERQVTNGQPARLGPGTHYADHMEVRRAYNNRGVFVALLRFSKPARMWHPLKVFQLSRDTMDVTSPSR